MPRIALYYRRSLSVLYDDLSTIIVVTDVDELLVLHSKSEKLLFLKTKKSLSTTSIESSSSTTDSTWIKLSKLDVPTFDGNIHGKQFWDQFTVSVHNRLNLSNAEKNRLFEACDQGWISEKCDQGPIPLFKQLRGGYRMHA